MWEETKEEPRRIICWIEGEEKGFYPFWWKKKEMDSVSKGKKFHLLAENWKIWHKAPIRYSGESKSLRAARLNLSGDFFFFLVLLFSLFFLLSVWVTAFIIFPKWWGSERCTDKRRSSPDTFLSSAVPRSKAQSSEWINTKLTLV